jgi:putative colanic acid biosynthesis acetyltransferase WcaF
MDTSGQCPVRLDQFDNRWFTAGRPTWIQVLWYCMGLPVLRSSLVPFSSVRRRLLRCFGAQVGRGVVIKPGVRVKYPWRLRVGDHAWIGEDVWIDNLAEVSIGAHACLSQGAYLCTGNHNWSDPAFGLVVKPISIERGAWVGAKALIGPGTTVQEGAIVTAGGVAVKTIPAYEIHSGNPARFVKHRKFVQGGE